VPPEENPVCASELVVLPIDYSIYVDFAVTCPDAQALLAASGLRRTLTGGKVFMTGGVNVLPVGVKASVLQAVRTFEAFDTDNDPHREHDFGAFEVGQEKFFFKLDYYDRDIQFGSEEPSDPEQTTRVLTIMRAEEY
jgi:Protein of unknown function (DUF3768)